MGATEMAATSSTESVASHLRVQVGACMRSDATSWRWASDTVEVRAPREALRLIAAMTSSVDDAPTPITERLCVIEDAPLAENLEQMARDTILVDGAHGRRGRVGDFSYATLGVRAWPESLVVGRFDSGHWCAVVAPGPRAARAADIALKQILEHRYDALGAVIYHGSLVVRPGCQQGSLFLGRAGAGKTTAALRVARLGGRFVSGDRTFVLERGQQLLAVGSAQSTRVRWGTLEGLGLAERVLAHPPVRHGVDHGVLQGELPEKVVVGHRELEAFGLVTGSACELGEVFLIEARDLDEEPSISEIAPDATLLAEHIRNTWLHGPAAVASSTPPAALVRCRWFRMRWVPALDSIDDMFATIDA